MINMNSGLSKYAAQFVTSDYFIGAVSLLALLFFAKIFLKKHWILVSTSRFGKVRMSRRALYAILYGLINNIQGICGRRVRLTIRHGKIYINIHIKLDICCNIPALSEDVQVRVSNVLSNDLGLDNIGKINVEISGFSPKSYRDHRPKEACETKVEHTLDEIN
jgi:uncharacterized alkaline shock family protein YloU